MLTRKFLVWAQKVFIGYICLKIWGKIEETLKRIWRDALKDNQGETETDTNCFMA